MTVCMMFDPVEMTGQRGNSSAALGEEAPAEAASRSAVSGLAGGAAGSGVIDDQCQLYRQIFEGPTGSHGDLRSGSASAVQPNPTAGGGQASGKEKTAQHQHDDNTRGPT